MGDELTDLWKWYQNSGDEKLEAIQVTQENLHLFNAKGLAVKIGEYVSRRGPTGFQITTQTVFESFWRLGPKEELGVAEDADPNQGILLQLRRKLSSVEHPAHYNVGKIEVWDFIDDQGLNFFLGNVVKYVCRSGRKNPDDHLEDLLKAQAFLTKEIELRKKVLGQ